MKPMRIFSRMLRPAMIGLTALLVLTACSTQQQQAASSVPAPTADREERNRERTGSIFGPGGLSLGTGNGQRERSEAGTEGIGVNSFLWRASLDTISFMPVTSADPFGGVILTDWYTPPDSPDERFKLNIYILDRQLRANGIRVAVFRQTRDPRSGGWADSPVDPTMATALEDTILTRARELRIASGSASR